MESMKRILTVISVALLFCVCIAFGTQRAVPTTYPTIQSAINAAVSGDTVVVAAGTYAEAVTVNKSIVLLGTGPSVVVAPVSGAGITISANNVAVQSLRVCRSTTNGISASAISNLTLMSIIADSNAGSGFQLSNVSGATFVGCNFSRNKDEGLNALTGNNFQMTDCIADSNGNGSNGSGVNLKGIVGPSTITNLTAVGNHVHGLSIGTGSSQVVITGGVLNSNGSGRADGTGAGLNIFADGKTTIASIAIQGTVNSSNNTTAGILINASTSGDTVRSIVIGSSGSVTLTNNGGAGVIMLGNVKDATITASMTKSSAFAAGVLIGGIDFYGNSSPINIVIKKCSFSNDYRSNQPAISLSAGVYPYTSVNPVFADSNNFTGTTRISAIDSLIYDRLDDPTLGLVTHLHDNYQFMPTVALGVAQIAFGDARKDTAKTETLVIKNPASASLILDSIYTRTQWFAAGLPKSTISSGDSLLLSISFTPDSIRNYNDTLYLKNNSLTPVVRLPLNGFSTVPVMVLDKSSLAFGSVGIFDTAAATLKVTNSSANLLVIDSIYSSTTAFTPAAARATVGKNDTLNLFVRFIPGQIGSFNDTLRLRNNSSTVLQKISLSGNSPSPSISIAPSVINFGSVKVDSTRQLLFLISNTSLSLLKIDSLYTGTKQFDVIRKLANSIVKKGDSAIVTIRFRPSALGEKLDTLFVACSDPASPFRVPLSGTGVPTTGVSTNVSGVPQSYALYQNYPNPFNPSTRIRYAIPAQSHVRIELMNSIGQRIATLIDEVEVAGYYETRWTGTGASAIYFCRIEATPTDGKQRRFVEVRKMILLK